MTLERILEEYAEDCMIIADECGECEVYKRIIKALLDKKYKPLIGKLGRELIREPDREPERILEEYAEECIIVAIECSECKGYKRIIKALLDKKYKPLIRKSGKESERCEDWCSCHD